MCAHLCEGPVVQALRGGSPWPGWGLPGQSCRQRGHILPLAGGSGKAKMSWEAARAVALRVEGSSHGQASVLIHPGGRGLSPSKGVTQTQP